jgi:hypothetical protein
VLKFEAEVILKRNLAVQYNFNFIGQEDDLFSIFLEKETQLHNLHGYITSFSLHQTVFSTDHLALRKELHNICV